MEYIWNFNTDVERRNEIIFGNYPTSICGGLQYFEGLTLKQLIQLRDENFLSLEDGKYGLPTIGDIMNFMQEHEGFTAHGYAVTVERRDYRVSLEGVEKTENITDEDIDAFKEVFDGADDFRCEDDYLYCWYD